MASATRNNYASELERRHNRLNRWILLLVLTASLLTLGVVFRRLIFNQLQMEAQAIRKVSSFDSDFIKLWLQTNPNFFVGIQKGAQWLDNGEKPLSPEQMLRLATQAGAVGSPKISFLHFEDGFHFVLCERTDSGFFVVARRGENAWFYSTALFMLALALSAYRLLTRSGLQYLLHPVETHIEGLQELNRSKEAFFAGIFHELGTPLTSLMSRLELLIERNQAQPAELKRLYLDAQRIETLSSDQLLRARIETGHFSLQPEPCSAQELAESLALRLEFFLQHHGKSLKTSAPDDLIFKADRVKLEQALTNLILNAAKHAPDGEQIELRFSETSRNAILIEVRDQGQGFDLNKISQYTQAFEQGGQHTSTGQGLGLFLVQQIAKAHGGTLSYQKDAHGFCARIELDSETA